MFDHWYGDAYSVYSVLTILVLFTETAIVVVSFGHRRMRTELYKYQLYEILDRGLQLLCTVANYVHQL